MWGDCEVWNRGNDIDGYCGWSMVMVNGDEHWHGDGAVG